MMWRRPPYLAWLAGTGLLALLCLALFASPEGPAADRNRGSRASAVAPPPRAAAERARPPLLPSPRPAAPVEPLFAAAGAPLLFRRRTRTIPEVPPDTVVPEPRERIAPPPRIAAAPAPTPPEPRYLGFAGSLADPRGPPSAALSAT